MAPPRYYFGELPSIFTIDEGERVILLSGEKARKCSPMYGFWLRSCGGWQTTF